MQHEEVENIPVARLAPGDIVTLPGVAGLWRIQVVRAAVPGVAWLYLVDPVTGTRRRGHVALPMHRTVARHVAAPDRDLPPPDEV